MTELPEPVSVLGMPPTEMFLRRSYAKAHKYFSEDDEERNAFRAKLARFGITSAEILAKSAELNCEPLQMIEQMIAARDNNLRKLRKEARQNAKRRDDNE
jgi:hypothetical protein